jgi:hypothetical protein
MNTNNIKHLGLLLLCTGLVEGCGKGKGYHDTADVADCEPATSSATCSEEEGVICIMITGTEEAAAEYVDKMKFDSFAEAALDLSFNLEFTIHTSGLDCSTDTRYDLVIVEPNEIQIDGIPVTDALLMTGAGSEVFQTVLDNMASLTDVSAVQKALNADVVLMMVGKSVYTAADSGGRVVDISVGNEVSDDPEAMWGAYYWGSFSSGPHEFGHLLGAQHDEIADSTCDSVFDHACGHINNANNIRSVMSYWTSCADGSCGRLYMFSNPNRTHPDYSSMMGDNNEYNACTVYHMWNYISLASDAYNTGLTGHAIDTNYYNTTSCPSL